jgi:putative ABC transport system ATP-binding protein
MLKMKDINVRNVLSDLNLTVNRNEFVLVVGDNGAGKTTLFNAISGNLKPKSGSILIDDQDVTNLPQYERATVVANVFQDPKMGTIGSMTIRENLNMAYMRGKKRALSISNSEERDKLYREKLRTLDMGLENRLDNCVENLSGGQRQALSIIMSLVSDSKILLLDEVTAAIDTKTSDRIIEIIDENIRQQKKTCLMITHNAKQIDKLADRVLVLKNGNV